uniref:Uncharacterized protein n=1 Tax=Bombyx mori TaxID=7091 RepID=Q86QT5_BOMMO|nr:unknown [Bombyx mori]
MKSYKLNYPHTELSQILFMIILADPADFVVPQSINKRPKHLYKINLKQTKGIRQTGDTSKEKQNCYFYLIPRIFIFI